MSLNSGVFRLNYDFAGGLQPMGFHVVNIILHAMVSVLFLLVFSVFLTGRMLDEDDHLTFDAPRASLFAALLFAIHPVHTECVSYKILLTVYILCIFF